MRGRLGWAGIAAGVAGLMMSAVGIVPAADAAEPGLAPLSVAGMAVPLSLSGELVAWGTDQSGGSLAAPAQYAGVAFSQAVMTSNAVIALTSAGQVVGWGTNQYRMQQIPTDVAAAKVVQIAANNDGFAGAVTADGRVLVWGIKRTRPTPLNDIPAGLTGVKKLALAEEQAVALKQDGTVVAWGDNTNGVKNVPTGLHATDITVANATATALTTDRTVVQWGASGGSMGRPASVELTGNVKAIADRAGATMAWLADDSLVVWGTSIQPTAMPPSAQPLLLGSGSVGTAFAMVDQQRELHIWNPFVRSCPTLPNGCVPFDVGAVPAGLNGRAISQVALGIATVTETYSTGVAIVTKFLAAASPQVTGATTVGSVLTGVPGTFSASPESVNSEWLVNGTVVGAGAQLSLTAAMLGKTVTYRSTASKAGEGTLSSSSAGVVVTAAAPPPITNPIKKVTSSTKVVKVKVAKKGAQVAVTGKVTATKPMAGKASVTIKKGKKTIVTKTVNVTATGALALTVKKFAKLVAKKTKAKGKKAKTAYRGSYTVSIKYAGNPQVNGSTGTGRFKVKK
jgi:hypothetical protein